MDLMEAGAVGEDVGGDGGGAVVSEGVVGAMVAGLILHKMLLGTMIPIL